MPVDKESRGGSSSPGETYHPTSWECEEAVALAEAMLPTIGKMPQDYKLVAAGNLRSHAGAYRGPHFWHLTFKLRKLIPSSSEGILGAGGEIFVEVDLAEKRAWVTGYGE